MAVTSLSVCCCPERNLAAKHSITDADVSQNKQGSEGPPDEDSEGALSMASRFYWASRFSSVGFRIVIIELSREMMPSRSN